VALVLKTKKAITPTTTKKKT